MHNLTEQYKTNQPLQTRIEIHQKYTIGEPLENLVGSLWHLTPTNRCLILGLLTVLFRFAYATKGI